MVRSLLTVHKCVVYLANKTMIESAILDLVIVISSNMKHRTEYKIKTLACAQHHDCLKIQM